MHRNGRSGGIFAPLVYIATAQLWLWVVVGIVIAVNIQAMIWLSFHVNYAIGADI